MAAAKLTEPKEIAVVLAAAMVNARNVQVGQTKTRTATQAVEAMPIYFELLDAISAEFDRRLRPVLHRT